MQHCNSVASLSQRSVPFPSVMYTDDPFADPLHIHKAENFLSKGAAHTISKSLNPFSDAARVPLNFSSLHDKAVVESIKDSLNPFLDPSEDTFWSARYFPARDDDELSIYEDEEEILLDPIPYLYSERDSSTTELLAPARAHEPPAYNTHLSTAEAPLEMILDNLYTAPCSPRPSQLSTFDWAPAHFVTKPTLSGLEKALPRVDQRVEPVPAQWSSDSPTQSSKPKERLMGKAANGRDLPAKPRSRMARCRRALWRRVAFFR
ncbi:hypothetical protein BOTBODRAFT_143998 [Botryobasidium botryosum FD-172 SS1]|uniref:Uncharacterized protein n=1 Tax=Botryobasidium botryosum (strain FD-172 SS1) TaxID=930990 RepID=A0A067MSI6_BOTB1|nr:hypothetical protein BOTBODRAFT_143998 [Botryobasidium botryosum FD-172 SS1]